MATVTSTRDASPGRPRQFDPEVALDAAEAIFRERGFHATSITDLGTAMGLTTGSIYKAFTDKRSVFLATFDRYTRRRQSKLADAIALQSTGLSKVRALLQSYALASVGMEGRRGCLVVGGATQLTTFDAEIASRITNALTHMEALLFELVELGKRDGSLNRDIDAEVAARTVLCFLQGARVVGKTGRTKKEMLSAVDMVLRMLV